MTKRTRFARKERLARKLLALAPAAEQELAKAALRGAARIIATAERFVPVGDGDLKESGAAILLPASSERSRVVAAAVFRAPHAHLVEFGTDERTHRGGKSVGRTPAQPFLFPAYRINKKGITAAMSRAINKSTKDIAKK